MSELPMDALLAALAALRSDPSREPSIRGAVGLLAETLDKQLSPGARLKIRRGSLHDLMAIAAKLLPGCTHCNSVCPAIIFKSRAEQAGYAQCVDGALSNGIITRIARPTWMMPDTTQLGPMHILYVLLAALSGLWSSQISTAMAHGLV